MNARWNLARPVRPIIGGENLLLSDAIEFNWQHNPTYPFYIFSAQHGPQSITHLEFGRAAHRAAHLLRPDLTGRDGEVVAIIAETDTILYQTITTGLVVAGLIPFLISPWISGAGVAHMLMETSCHRLLTTTTLNPLIEEMKAHLPKSHELYISEIPSLDAVYPQLAHEDVNYPFHPYLILQRPSITDTCILVHSSGTTGFPKAIAKTHLDFANSLQSPGFREYSRPLLLGTMALAPSSSYARWLEIYRPVFDLIPIATFPPSSTTQDGMPILRSPQNVIDHAKATNANALFVVPLYIEAWSRSPEIVDYLKELEFVVYGGSRLLPRIGKKLTAAGVKIKSFYASSEIGGPTSFLPISNGTDWEYVKFFDYLNIRWIPCGDGAFECQFLKCEKHQPRINNLPDVEGFTTGDIFKPHPTEKGLWKHVGRLNEIIVHSSGNKTIPGPIEDIILSDPLVQAAVVFGQDHEKPGVLIELKEDVQGNPIDQDAITRLQDQLWPTIDEANQEVAELSKISKDMILFTSIGKPLSLTPIKRVLMREQALDLYATEISGLYAEMDLSKDNAE